MNNKLQIRAITSDDSKWIKDIMGKSWGGLPLIIRGKKYYPTEGIVAENDSGVAGFIFFEIQKTDCEIVVFEIFDKFKGTGTIMLNKLYDLAKDKKCKRIYLMTTNDNLDALRFYQRRGFSICGIHLDSIKISRKMKPSIGPELPKLRPAATWSLSNQLLCRYDVFHDGWL